MKCGIIEFMPTYGLNDYVLMGLRLLKAGQAVWEMPVIKWQLGYVNGLWVNIGTAQEVDADKLVVRLGHALTQNRMRIFNSSERELATQTYETPPLPIQPQEPLQEYPFDLPASPPSTPPPPPDSPVLLGGLSLDKTQVTPGEVVRVGVQIHVNATFRGQINVWLGTTGAPVSGTAVSTGMRDFLSGSYSVPLEMGVSQSVPPGQYPLTVRVNDQYNNALTEFTTDPVLEVLAAPPPTPAPTGVIISSLNVNPTQVKPGDKVAATAQVTVSGGFKGFMSFSLAGVTESTEVKDWLAGNYPVTLEVTVPSNTPSGTYQAWWLVIDTQASKQLASKDIQVEVMAPTPTPNPTPSPASDWLTPLVGVAALAAVGGMVTQVPRIMKQFTGGK